MPVRHDKAAARIARCAGVAAVLIALAGCESGNLFQGEPTPWDGRWTGRMLFKAGEPACVKRGAVRVEIAGGDLTGTVRGSGADFGVRGEVLEDGEVYKGLLTRHSQPTAGLEGRFEDETFDGRWKYNDGRCRGTIKLRRVGR